MVLGVEVHVPVKKLEEGVEVDRSATDSEIGVLVLESDVLGDVDEIVGCGTEGAGEGDGKEDWPVASREAGDHDCEVTEEDDFCPAVEGRSHFGVFFGEKGGFPSGSKGSES